MPKKGQKSLEFCHHHRRRLLHVRRGDDHRPRACAACSVVKAGMDDHVDIVHVDIITEELWPGEFLTIRRKKGQFHCRWCVDRGYGDRSQFPQ